MKSDKSSNEEWNEKPKDQTSHILVLRGYQQRRGKWDFFKPLRFNRESRNEPCITRDHASDESVYKKG